MSGEEYVPKPGDEVLLSIRAKAYRLAGDRVGFQLRTCDGTLKTGDLVTVWPEHDGVVRVEPAPVDLPRGVGAVVRATVGVGDSESRRVWVLPGTGGAEWKSIDSEVWALGEEMRHVEVLSHGYVPPDDAP